MLILSALRPVLQSLDCPAMIAFLSLLNTKHKRTLKTDVASRCSRNVQHFENLHTPRCCIRENARVHSKEPAPLCWALVRAAPGLPAPPCGRQRATHNSDYRCKMQSTMCIPTMCDTCATCVYAYVCVCMHKLCV